MKKKKIRLRPWFSNLLLIIMIFTGIVLVSDAETFRILVLKSFIGLPVIFIICYVLSVYGGLNE